MNVRLIARLDIKGPNLVKGVQLEGLRVLGKPERFASRYFSDGIDELFLQDVVASLYERNSLHDIVSQTARQVFVPLCVGGGIRSLEDIRDVLRAGADKVSLNTAAIRDPNLIRRASRRFGSSTIVVSIEAIRQPSGSYEAFTDNGRERTGLDAIDWAKRAASLGAGEVLVTAVDREGTGSGFDLGLIRSVADSVDVPVIGLGGAGRVEHVIDAAINGNASAVACASLFHYFVINELKHDAGEFDPGIDLSAMQAGRTFSRITPASIQETRNALRAAGVAVRSAVEEMV